MTPVSIQEIIRKDWFNSNLVYFFKLLFCLFQGHGWNLKVSAGELLGRTHEELVLLLIQLRRQRATVCQSMEKCHREIEAQVYSGNFKILNHHFLVQKQLKLCCIYICLLWRERNRSILLIYVISCFKSKGLKILSAFIYIINKLFWIQVVIVLLLSIMFSNL